MKKLIIILFAISLYTPEATQILDFSQCIFSVLTTSNGEICDCLLTSYSTNNTNDKAVATHNHKHIEYKQIDKQIQETDYNFTSFASKINAKQNPVNQNLFHSNFLNETFHPPSTDVAKFL